MNLAVLAQNLAAARAARGYTLRYVAQQAGVSIPSICHYEKGKRIPPIDKLASIAELYGTTVDKLIN